MNKTRTFGFVVGCVLLGCSSSTTTDGGTGGAASGGGGAGGTSGAAGSGGAQCTSVTGTYTVTGTRDTANAGSCPTTLKYPASATATIQAKTGGFDVHMVVDGTTDISCVASVFGCNVTATCTTEPVASTQYKTEINWTLNSTGFSGTEKWTDYSGTTPHCAANWNVTGVRQ